LRGSRYGAFAYRARQHTHRHCAPSNWKGRTGVFGWPWESVPRHRAGRVRFVASVWLLDVYSAALEIWFCRSASRRRLGLKPVAFTTPAQTLIRPDLIAIPHMSNSVRPAGKRVGTAAYPEWAAPLAGGRGRGRPMAVSEADHSPPASRAPRRPAAQVRLATAHPFRPVAIGSPVSVPRRALARGRIATGLAQPLEPLADLALRASSPGK